MTFAKHATHLEEADAEELAGVEEALHLVVVDDDLAVVHELQDLLHQERVHVDADPKTVAALKRILAKIVSFIIYPLGTAHTEPCQYSRADTQSLLGCKIAPSFSLQHSPDWLWL